MVKGHGTVREATAVATGSTDVEQGSPASVDGGRHVKDLVYSANGDIKKCRGLRIKRGLYLGIRVTFSDFEKCLSQTSGTGSWQKRCREEESS